LARWRTVVRHGIVLIDNQQDKSSGEPKSEQRHPVTKALNGTTLFIQTLNNCF
jgi:hypothetical protein